MIARLSSNWLRRVPLLLILAISVASGDQLPPAELPIAALPLAGQPFSVDVATLPRLRLPAFNPSKLPVQRNDKGPQQIGVARALPESDLRRLDGHNPEWHRLDDGRHLLGLVIESSGAIALRIGLRIQRLPPEATLRFGSDDPGAATPIDVVAGDVLRMLGINYAAAPQDPTANIYWSPVVAGEQIAVELELPAGVEPNEVDIEVAQLSHLYAAWLPHGDRLLKRDLGLAGSCHNDVKCSSVDIQALGESTAKITFQDGGSSFVCTGSLLNDQDPSGGFHFLTANHCIPNQLAASTIEFHWLFRASACSSAIRDPGYVRQTGGALLLSTLGGDFDTTLLRLNQVLNPQGPVACHQFTHRDLQARQHGLQLCRTEQPLFIPQDHRSTGKPGG